MAVKTLEREHALGDWQNELFRVQCRILDLGTDTAKSAPELRRSLMALRQEIIDFREQSVMRD
jgi:hypothetical protein